MVYDRNYQKVYIVALQVSIQSYGCIINVQLEGGGCRAVQTANDMLMTAVKAFQESSK